MTKNSSTGSAPKPGTKADLEARLAGALAPVNVKIPIPLRDEIREFAHKENVTIQAIYHEALTSYLASKKASKKRS